MNLRALAVAAKNSISVLSPNGARVRLKLEILDERGEPTGESFDDVLNSHNWPTLAASSLRYAPAAEMPGRSLLFALSILSTYTDNRYEPIRFGAIRHVLIDKAKKKADPLAEDAHSAIEVERHCLSFMKELLRHKDIASVDSSTLLSPGQHTPAELAGIAKRMGLAFAEQCSKIGERGAKASSTIRDEVEKRAAEIGSGSLVQDLCYMWFPPILDPSTGSYKLEPPVFLAVLVTCLWDDVVRRDLAVPTFRIAQVTQGDDAYAKLPKIVSPISWGMGGPGIVAEVDGDAYAKEPSIAPKIPNLTGKLLPRSWALLPKGRERRPHQTILPLELVEEPETLAVMVAQAQGYVITPQASKLALFWLASPEIRDGGIARATIGDLAKGTLGESVKRIQQRELVETARALEELDWLHIYLPDETKFRIFSVRRPWTPKHAKADMEAYFGIDPHFADLLKKGIHGGQLHGNEYDGDFLINLTGMMQLPNKRPALLRHYVRAAAHWNAYFVPGKPGTFDRSRMPFYDLREWASMTNCLPLAVVEYLKADPEKRKTLARSRKVSASQAIAAVRTELEELHDRKLVQVEKHGEGYRMVPPRAYLDAKQIVRTEGTRPKK